MQNKYNQEQFEELVTKFMFYMDLVFHSDWEHSKGCLENMSWFISEEGSFLYPKVQNEESNWENRGNLLKAYRELDNFLQKHDIRNREIDEYFSEEQDDNEKTDFILLAEKYLDENGSYPELTKQSIVNLFEGGYRVKKQDDDYIKDAYNKYAKESNECFERWSILRFIVKLNDAEKIKLALRRLKPLFVLVSLSVGRPVFFNFSNLLGVLNNAIDHYREEGDIILKAIKVYKREGEISKLDARKKCFKRKTEIYQDNKPIQDKNFVEIVKIIFPELK